MNGSCTNVSELMQAYGFSKGSNDLSNFDEFCAQYEKVLSRRDGRWRKYMKKNDVIEKSKTLKRFVRKGVPSTFRRQVWMSVSGAAALMDSERGHYQKLLTSDIPEQKVVAQIDADVPRTFPENDLFQADHETASSMLRPLRNVLYAFAVRNPNIGYCQGLNYIAGVLLIIVKDEEETFWLLNTLTTKIVTPDYYTKTLIGVKRDCFVLSRLIKEKFPTVGSTLENQSISLILLCAKWFICLFCDILPIETLLRVFDCIFYEGDKIIFRVAMTLIHLHAKEIAECRNFPEIVAVFRTVSSERSSVFCHQFMENVFKKTAGVKRSEIERLRNEFKTDDVNDA